jgi:N-acetylglutamate synthase-like GNAT family acetyltransferase
MAASHRVPAFSERSFYLEEFRGRTLAIACRAASLRQPRRLRSVVETLARNGTRALVLSTGAEALRAVVGARVIEADPGDAGFSAQLWRRLRREARLGVVCGDERSFTDACCAIAAQIGVFKLGWIDSGGGLRGGGRRLSFVHRAELRALLPQAEGRRAHLLRAIDSLLGRGVDTVNICTLDGLREELFTYDGSGTLFTRDRYIEVRPLAIDDFDAAHGLIARGVKEGALLRRRAREVDQILSAGFGAFVEARDLAGVASLLIYRASAAEPAAGEIACLYTLTRFLGEGVGAELVDHALREAQRERVAQVFACTSNGAAGRFFVRCGFSRVARSRVPDRKWQGYDTRRLRRVRVYSRPL